MRVGIIGAGPAGLSAGHQLARQGVEVEIFEGGPAVGGMCRSFSLWGQTVDLGPHRFFSQDARVNRLWLEIVGRDYRMINRLTRIYYGGRYFQYPLQPLNALRNLGLVEAVRCVASYMRQRLAPIRDENTFESWVVRKFGRRLFEVFFKTYSEKLWGISCQQLDADFAEQRIKKLSLGEAIKNAVGFGARQHQTLVDQFAYPLGGTGMVYERMAEVIRILGNLRLETPVRRILHRQHRVHGLELHDGTTHSFDHVISTMPLTLMVKGLEGAPSEVQQAADALRFRNTILVYLQIEGTELFPDQWVYVHAPELAVGRVTNFRNWIPELHGSANDTILSLEYWCDHEDEQWSASDTALIDQARREIRATGLIGGAQVLQGTVVRIPRCYPVYARNYQQHLATISRYLAGFEGLTPIGRYGAFKYNNQDHSILMGILAAENLLGARDHNLWQVNTDYGTYQEATSITAAGLVPTGV